ncbi:MAG: hypothetical protein HPY44_21480 [Armatimonadetes bacterium]|nr:hypothetical protein [Armatimonadota bacterium]
MSKRTTIGNNPLDAVVPQSVATQDTPAETAARQPASKRPKSSASGVASVTAAQVVESADTQPPAGEKTAKERLTVHLPVDLIDRVKNAVYWTPGLTLAALAEDALRARVEGMEAERGEAFPARTEPLKGGRPLK